LAATDDADADAKHTTKCAYIALLQETSVLDVDVVIRRALQATTTAATTTQRLIRIAHLSSTRRQIKCTHCIRSASIDARNDFEES
jgi:hypothetical protein